jgi:hypothetical protein
MEQIMRTIVSAAFLITILVAAPATAGRPVSDAERASLTAAVTAQGCSGGKMEWDAGDQHFEVDDVRCADGRTYDMKFDKSFQFIRKTLEN